MNGLKRPVKVYLCKSARTSERKLQVIRARLVACGFQVFEYDGGMYSDQLLRKCDVVYAHSHDVVDSAFFEDGNLPYDNARKIHVGKGQYNELLLAQKLKKICFIGRNIMQSFAIDRDVIFKIIDKDSWKVNYGVIYPKSKNNKGTDFINYVKMFYFHDNGEPVIMMPEDRYKYLNRLLLIID